MKSLSIEKESYGSLHIPILASKFTTDLRAKFTDNVWLLDQLLVILKNELEAKERFDSPGDKHFEKGECSKYRSTTSSFHTGRKFIKGNCAFCSSKNLINAQK